MIGENSDREVAKVRRDTLEALFTCPLCKQLYNEALSINECMHTFCKKCIHDKIIGEDARACPVCNVSLGCSPLDKLRADHNWERLRTTLFPLKGNKCKEISEAAQLTEINKGDTKGSMEKAKGKGKARDTEEEEDEDTPLLVVPFIDIDSDLELDQATTKKKEKSLSSLVVNDSSKMANKKPVITNRRSKLGARKKSFQACRKKPLSPGHLLELEDDETQMLTPKSPEEQLDYKQTDAVVQAAKRVDNLSLDPPVFLPNEPHKHKGKEKVDDQELALHEELKLSSLVPSTSVKPRRKYQRRRTTVHQHRSDVFPEKIDKSKRKITYHQQKSDIASDKSPVDMTTSRDGKNNNQREKTQRGRRANVIPNVVIDLTRSQDDTYQQTKIGHQQNPNVVEKDIVSVTARRPTSFPAPVWFCLLAAEDQKGDAPLPQLSDPYIRMKDVNAPVSCIAKYLAKKFNLTSENEVELMMHGHPILDSLTLQNLREVWQELNPKSEKIMAVAGSSAKDVTMQLTYARKYLA